jgi:hypothetical protein
LRFQPFKNRDQTHGAAEARRHALEIHSRARGDAPLGSAPERAQHLSLEFAVAAQLTRNASRRGKQSNPDATAFRLVDAARVTGRKHSKHGASLAIGDCGRCELDELFGG